MKPVTEQQSQSELTEQQSQPQEKKQLTLEELLHVMGGFTGVANLRNDKNTETLEDED